MQTLENSDISIDFIKGDVTVSVFQKATTQEQSFFQVFIKTKNFFFKTLSLKHEQKLFGMNFVKEKQYLQNLKDLITNDQQILHIGQPLPKDINQLLTDDVNRLSKTLFTGFYILDVHRTVIGRIFLGGSFHPFDPSLFGIYAPSLNEVQLTITLDKNFDQAKCLPEIIKSGLTVIEIFKEQHIYKLDCNKQLKPVDRVVIMIKSECPFAKQTIETLEHCGFTTRGFVTKKGVQLEIFGKDL